MTSLPPETLIEASIAQLSKATDDPRVSPTTRGEVERSLRNMKALQRMKLAKGSATP